MSHSIHRSAHRHVVHETDRTTRHSFSFGSHYDPANLGFGPMVAHFDDRLVPGGGYDEHAHTDLEILTWVLGGALRHTDSTGATTLVESGCAQAMSAGSGIRHSERSDAASGPTRFVQVWVRPDEPGTAPRHATTGVAAALDSAELVPVASGHHPDALLRIGARDATFGIARLRPGQVLTLPEEARQHLYVATGGLQLAAPGRGDRLAAGDAARIVDEPGREVAAGPEGVELLLWSFRG